MPKTHNSHTYYLSELHGAADGIPRHTKVAAELEVALANMGVVIPYQSPDKHVVLEIGAGIGIYAPMFMQRGFRYEAVEMDRWACQYIRGAYSPHVHNVCFEDFTEALRWDAIITAHALEHMNDAPAMLEKMHKILRPGGRLYMIIPDDTDLGNPDHKWFFTREAITRWFDEVGFANVKSTIQQIVIWEKFIYIVGEKLNG